MFLLYFIYTKSNLSIRTWQKEHVPSPFLKIPVLASELLLSTWLFPSRAKLPLVNYITHLYEEAESTWNTWLVAEHMLKRAISVQSNSDGRIVGPGCEKKKGHVHYVRRPRSPWP